MAKEKEMNKRWQGMNNSGDAGAIYGLGIIGAALYFIQHATGFWMGVIGVIKAIFWPALIIYKVLELLHL